MTMENESEEANVSVLLDVHQKQTQDLVLEVHHQQAQELERTRIELKALQGQESYSEEYDQVCYLCEKSVLKSLTWILSKLTLLYN